MLTNRQMHKEDMGQVKKPGAGTMEKMPMGQEISGGETVLPINQYPELKGAEAGKPVSGSFEGTVKSNDGKNVTIAYTSVELVTENAADKEFSRMKGGNQEGAPAEDEDSEV